MKTMRLKSNASLIDVYQDFRERAYGSEPAIRSLEDLRAAIAIVPNAYIGDLGDGLLRYDANVLVSMDWVRGLASSPNAFLEDKVQKTFAFVDKLAFTFGDNIDAYEWLLQGLARAECCMCVNREKEIAFIGVREVNGEPWIIGYDLDEMGDRIGDLYAVAPLQDASLHIY
jgi:hypothetical protein